jgi:DNA-binding transcriptional LysR family regulator
MRVTLKQLTVFDAVARLGSIKAAAEEISLSQSATTMSLQDLERNLGVELFRRYKKRLTLNENGRRLQPRARSLILQVKEIESVSSLASSLMGRLKVAASTNVGGYVIPALCRDFLAIHPDVKISLKTGGIVDTIGMVESMACDIGLIETPVHRPSLVSKRLGSYSQAIFASPEHPLAGRERVAIDELRDQSWFVPSISSIVRTTVLLELGDRFGTLNIRFECDAVEALKNAVKGSPALSCLPLLAVENDIAAGTLTEIHVPELRLTRSFHLIHRKDVYHGEVHRAFIDHVVSAFAQCAGEAGEGTPEAEAMLLPVAVDIASDY